MRLFAIFTVLSIITFGSVYALERKDFPLWGSTWVVGEGENKWIYPSAARFRPNKVALIKFNEYSDNDNDIAAEIQYANLQTCDPMYSTAAAIDEMMRQFNMNKYEIRTNQYCSTVININEFVYNCSTKYSSKFSDMQKNAREGKILVPFGEINDDYSPLHIEYYPYNDTVWTFHYYADCLDRKEYKRIVIQFGSQEVEYYVFPKDTTTIWTQEKPKLTTYRKITANDSIFAQYDTDTAVALMKYDNNSDDNIYAEIYMPKNGSIDVTNVQELEKLLIRRVKADDSGKVINIYEFELVEQHSLAVAKEKVGESKVFKTDNIGFWRLHITPEVWFFKRNRNGDTLAVMKDVKRFWHNVNDTDIAGIAGFNSLRCQFKSAVNKREDIARKIDKGINAAEDLENASEWLSPVISEISSTIISVSFMGGDSKIGDRIILDSQDKELESGGKLFFAHTPPRMYKVVVAGNDAVEKAAIKLSARNSLEEAEAEGLYRCSGYLAAWKSIDSITTGYIFPDSTFPRKRNPDVDDAVYMYDGCPCDTIKGIGKTPMELRVYIYKPVPTHSLSHAENALAVFNKLKVIFNVFSVEKDQEDLSKKISNAMRVVEALSGVYKKIYGKDRENFPTDCNNCPRTWLDDEPIKRILRGY